MLDHIRQKCSAEGVVFPWTKASVGIWYIRDVINTAMVNYDTITELNYWHNAPHHLPRKNLVKLKASPCHNVTV